MPFADRTARQVLLDPFEIEDDARLLLGEQFVELRAHLFHLLMRLGAHACQLRGIRLGQYGRASQSFAAEVGAARVVRVVDPYAGFLVGLVQADEFDVEQRIEFTLAALPVPLPVACGRVKVVDADYLDVFRHSPVEGVGQCVESAEGVRCVEVGVDAHLLYLMLGIGLTEFAHGSLLDY